jgi:peptidoglycan/LPS O-acetylase OafA/YrhL
MLWRPEVQVKSWARLVRLSSLVLVAALIFLLYWHPTVEVPLDISRFGHDSGFAYSGPAPTFGRVYDFKGDDSENHVQSTLTLLENGRPLGPPHTIHDAIRRVGDGLYSHWDDHKSPSIIFSTSDNTDPLTNGRHYSVSGAASLLPVLQSLAAAALLAILLANFYMLARNTDFVAADFVAADVVAAEVEFEKRASSIAYRSDIDGLRAIAVTLVILFHLGLTWVPGGYIGVDVFFVISGYLITGIILSQVGADLFSFVRFYQRRIKRIFPALFVTVAATMVTGFFLLLPGDYAGTAKSAIYAVFASSNFYFLFNTGYFDPAAELLPLLHTWSLGVEEQFYLVWPALMVGLALIFRRDQRAIVIALLFVALLSYVGGASLAMSDPKAAFYLPFTRAWEFVAGALLSQAVIGKLQIAPILAKASGSVGLALVVGSALIITNQTPFPSWSTALPVVGAALIVAPFNTHCVARKLLSSSPVVFVGRISYSLYLWHWPIITLYRHYNLGRPINIAEAFCLTALIAVASFLSWRYVEEPFRRARWPAWPTIGTGFATASALAAMSLVVVSYSGFPQRIPPSARLESLQVMQDWKCPQEKDIVQLGNLKRVCVLGAKWETAKTRGILLGDSHADHMAPLLDVAARSADIALFEPMGFFCMPLIGTTSLKQYFPERPTYTQDCADKFISILAYLHERDDIQVVVLASAWSQYLQGLYRHDNDERSIEIGLKLMHEGFRELVTNLGRDRNRQFLIISQVPIRQELNVGCLVRSNLLLRPSCPEAMFMTPTISSELQVEVPLDAMIRALPTELSNVSVSVPHDHLCGLDGCTTVLNDEFLYRDSNHLRKNLTTETKFKLSKRLQLRESLQQAVANLP